ncbi:hypothetical protein SBI_05547 [Streptomyces bingchenggensis BCW-1]|uniref:Uncharacterized protein n=1 Tax=Streptomyces bingchenggensis (strain BCW-1) TaxID=749414 RepID=D7CAV0_STRBB|nr:hypothetical protein SBI_05547 [Streptomyces bingchenggensis BCW-1]
MRYVEMRYVERAAPALRVATAETKELEPVEP